MTIIIAFIAPSKSGKTTASRYAQKILTEEYGLTKVEILSFATPLKRTAELMGFNMTQKDTEDKVLGITPRTFLKHFGDLLRETLPALEPGWMIGVGAHTLTTHLLLQKIQDQQVVLIDDLRYVEEYRALKEYGARFVHIFRPQIVPDLSHSSEREVYDILSLEHPYCIENNDQNGQALMVGLRGFFENVK